MIQFSVDARDILYEKVIIRGPRGDLGLNPVLQLLLNLRNTTGVSLWMEVPGVFLHLARSTNHSQCAEDGGQAKLGL